MNSKRWMQNARIEWCMLRVVYFMRSYRDRMTYQTEVKQ